MASMTPLPNNPITQIWYFTIDRQHDLKAHETWTAAIDILEQHPGFQRCYWGRSLEKPDDVQLHVVHSTLSTAKSLLSSPLATQFLQFLAPLTNTDQPPLTRHIHMHPFTLPSPLTSPFPPFIGSAIYISTTPTWHEGSWPLWTHIVRYVKGNIGIAGGRVVEEVDGCKECYLVYVGWQSVELHEEYHHTEHFKKRRIVLGLGNGGFREYGHVVFEGQRERPKGKL